MSLMFAAKIVEFKAVSIAQVINFFYIFDPWAQSKTRSNFNRMPIFCLDKIVPVA